MTNGIANYLINDSCPIQSLIIAYNDLVISSAIFLLLNLLSHFMLFLLVKKYYVISGLNIYRDASYLLSLTHLHISQSELLIFDLPTDAR